MTKEREAELRDIYCDDPACGGCEDVRDCLAEIDRLRAALSGMVDRFGLCLTAIFGSGMDIVTEEMKTRHCGVCPPCIARKALEQK